MVNVVNEDEETETLVKQYLIQADHPRNAISSAIEKLEAEFGELVADITRVTATAEDSPRGYRITIVAQPV